MTQTHGGVQMRMEIYDATADARAAQQGNRGFCSLPPQLIADLPEISRPSRPWEVWADLPAGHVDAVYAIWDPAAHRLTIYRPNQSTESIPFSKQNQAAHYFWVRMRARRAAYASLGA